MLELQPHISVHSLSFHFNVHDVVPTLQFIKLIMEARKQIVWVQMWFDEVLAHRLSRHSVFSSRPFLSDTMKSLTTRCPLVDPLIQILRK